MIRAEALTTIGARLWIRMARAAPVELGGGRLRGVAGCILRVSVEAKLSTAGGGEDVAELERVVLGPLNLNMKNAPALVT